MISADASNHVPGSEARQCAIVIASCDSYSETWGPFGTLFGRFWPDCPFPAYLVSNEGKFCSQRILGIRVGADVSWSDNILTALSQICEEYVILMVDDLFLAAPADTARIAAILEWMNRAGANCVHLYGRPRPATRTTGLVGPLPPGTYYRASAISSMWRKSVLKSVLRSGETAWDFEIQGSIRSDEFEGFYSALEPCFAFINGLIKGRWHPRAVAQLQKLGVAPDCRKRGLLGWNRRAALRLLSFRSKALELLPLGARGKVKAMIQRKSFRYRSYSS